MTKTSKTSHLKVKEIRQSEALTYIKNHKFPNLSEEEGNNGIIELWKNYRLFMQDGFHLRGNEKDYRGKYLEQYYKNPKWWAGIYDENKIVGTEYFTLRNRRMFSGFLFADSVEIAKELSTQLYELAMVTLKGELDIIESLHFTNVDEYDISFREELGYRAWSWIDERDKIRDADVRVSFLKKVREEWEEQKND